MGGEVNLPICSLTGKKPVHVFYTYYEGRPGSHRLEFRKGMRTTFEMFLPRYGKDISRLCSLAENQGYGGDGNKNDFGFWPRLALRLTAGKLISCRDIFPGPRSEIHTRFGDADAVYRYRLAHCRKGARESFVFVSSRHGSQSGPYRKGKSLKLNWLHLDPAAFEKLSAHLRVFMKSEAIANVREQGR